MKGRRTSTLNRSGSHETDVNGEPTGDSTPSAQDIRTWVRWYIVPFTSLYDRVSRDPSVAVPSVVDIHPYVAWLPPRPPPVYMKRRSTA